MRSVALAEAPPRGVASSHDQTVVMSVTTGRPVVTAERDLPALRVHKGHRTGPTGWRALDSAIARIPGYRPGVVRWVISDRFGHWGTTDWYHATLYISPAVPSTYMYDVVVHEWSHEVTVLDYDGDVPAATAATDRAFGGTGLVGEERAADCMAILQGATWTHYTSCPSAQWRAHARRLLRGEQL